MVVTGYASIRVSLLDRSKKDYRLFAAAFATNCRDIIIWSLMLTHIYARGGSPWWSTFFEYTLSTQRIYVQGAADTRTGRYIYTCKA